MATAARSNDILVRRVILSALGVITLGIAAAVLLWYLGGSPMYSPGDVRAGRNLDAPLEPPAQANASADWLVAPGITIHHFEQGAGQPVLVVHGGPGIPFEEPFRANALLASQYRMIYYDQRGTGRSTRPFDRFAGGSFYANARELNTRLGLPAQIADIERIRRLLGQPKLILLGHSFGAFIAALYAAEFPDNVAAIVAVSPANLAALPSLRDDLFQAIRRKLPQEKRAEYDAYVADYLDFRRIFTLDEAKLAERGARLARWYALASPESVVLEPTNNGGWMPEAQYFSMGRRHDYRDAFRKVSAPVLVIHGMRDVQSVESSRAFADMFMQGRAVTIGRAGHFAFDEQPELFARIVGRFLAEVGTERNLSLAAPLR
jgi:proline iminopeptidase